MEAWRSKDISILPMTEERREKAMTMMGVEESKESNDDSTQMGEAVV